MSGQRWTANLDTSTWGVVWGVVWRMAVMVAVMVMRMEVGMEVGMKKEGAGTIRVGIKGVGIERVGTEPPPQQGRPATHVVLGVLRR